MTRTDIENLNVGDLVERSLRDYSQDDENARIKIFGIVMCTEYSQHTRIMWFDTDIGKNRDSMCHHSILISNAYQIACGQ